MHVTYKKTANRLEKFSAGAPVPFHSIDHVFARRFETWLVSKRGNGASTINNHFTTIKAIINRAIREKRFEGPNPASGIRVKVEQAEKVRLTKDEIKRLSQVVTPPGTLVHDTQKMFMLSFWCGGIRFRDVVLLKWESVVEDRLVYRANKTRKPMSIKLVP